MGPGRGAPAYLVCWNCTCLPQQHSHQTGGQEKPRGPEKECEVVRDHLNSRCSSQDLLELVACCVCVMGRETKVDLSLSVDPLVDIDSGLTEKGLQAG